LLELRPEHEVLLLQLGDFRPQFGLPLQRGPVISAAPLQFLNLVLQPLVLCTEINCLPCG
jgi:hypothetical protein